MKIKAAVVSALSVILLHAAAKEPTKASSTPDRSWNGVYVSPAEIGGFAETKIEIQIAPFDRAKLWYRMTSQSDVVPSDTIKQSEYNGVVATDENKMFLPTANGSYDKGRPLLFADITRYRRIRIKGYTVLMRDDAWKAFRERDALYDYGILIKAPEDSGGREIHLEDAKPISIKVLYKHPKKGWRDPFVNGPNQR
jgi:hypothetical protein